MRRGFYTWVRDPIGRDCEQGGMAKKDQPGTFGREEYRALAEYRYLIRRYLRHMENTSRAAGIHHQQYQLLLAIEGLPKGKTSTIATLAERMQLNHNTTVELANRCEQRGLLIRTRSQTNYREVVLTITPEGKATLEKLVAAAQEELIVLGPSLVESVWGVIPALTGRTSSKRPAQSSAARSRRKLAN